jgi:hypothetical protein
MAIVYPEEDILLARGRYSTLNSEYKQQIERVMKNGKGVVDTMRQYLLLASNGIQERPTINRQSLDALRACLGNFENAWNRIDELLAEMEPLKAEAWDDQDA